MMKALLMALVLTAVTALAGEEMVRPKLIANPGFAKLTTLVGQWTGKCADGMATKATYRLVADGSALEEDMNHDASSMVTMFHTDNGRLMLTHYCAAHNQPRMRAGTFREGDNQLAFKFLDATNLPDQKAMHMHDLTFTFKDADHFQQEWTHYNDGKPGAKVVIEYERVK